MPEIRFEARTFIIHRTSDCCGIRLVYKGKEGMHYRHRCYGCQKEFMLDKEYPYTKIEEK